MCKGRLLIFILVVIFLIHGEGEREREVFMYEANIEGWYVVIGGFVSNPLRRFGYTVSTFYSLAVLIHVRDVRTVRSGLDLVHSIPQWFFIRPNLVVGWAFDVWHLNST